MYAYIMKSEHEEIVRIYIFHCLIKVQSGEKAIELAHVWDTHTTKMKDCTNLGISFCKTISGDDRSTRTDYMRADPHYTCSELSPEGLVCEPFH